MLQEHIPKVIVKQKVCNTKKRAGIFKIGATKKANSKSFLKPAGFLPAESISFNLSHRSILKAF